MATTTTFSFLSGVDTEISGVLQDALVEALVVPPDPCARSAVICTLIQEMCSIVDCLRGDETVEGRATEHELTSIRQVADAAHDHHIRMISGRPPVGMESR
jgi:hypothetical protein